MVLASTTCRGKSAQAKQCKCARGWCDCDIVEVKVDNEWGVEPVRTIDRDLQVADRGHDLVERLRGRGALDRDERVEEAQVETQGDPFV